MSATDRPSGLKNESIPDDFEAFEFWQAEPLSPTEFHEQAGTGLRRWLANDAHPLNHAAALPAVQTLEF